MAQVTLLYFASLRDAAGVASEALDTEAADLAALYAQARERHGFALPIERLRVHLQHRSGQRGTKPTDSVHRDLPFLEAV